MKRFVAIAALSVALFGCETSKQAYEMSQKGMEAFSCEEVTKAFVAYKADRQSTSGLTVLAPLISADIGTMSSSVLTTSDEYYNQAKASANTALALKGCTPVN